MPHTSTRAYGVNPPEILLHRKHGREEQRYLLVHRACVHLAGLVELGALFFGFNFLF